MGLGHTSRFRILLIILLSIMVGIRAWQAYQMHQLVKRIEIRVHEEQQRDYDQRQKSNQR